MRIGDTFYLPFSFTTHYAYEYTLTHKKHDKNTAKAKAKRMMKNLNAKYLEKGVEIVENNVKIMIDKNTCTLKGTLILKEPFGKLSPIEKISEPNMNSEEDSNARNNSKHESQ